MDRSMSVVMLSDASEFGGAEQFLRILTGQLAPRIEITLLGYDPEILAAERGDETVAAVTIDRSFLQARRAIARIRPDVVLGNLPSLSSCQAMIAATLSLRIPIVLVDHAPTPGLSSLGKAWQRFMTRRAAARISVGEAASRRTEELAGIPAGSVQTIHNGVPPKPVCAQRDDDSGLVVIGALGRLRHVKGLDILLESFAGVTGARLRIAGTGPRLGDLQRQVRYLGIADRVTFDGFCDPDTFLCGIDILALSSRSEALPLTVLEGMQHGKAIIATKVGSVGEVLTDGQTALLVPVNDPGRLRAGLQRLVDDPQLRAALGRRARERARAELTDSAMAAAYLEVLESVARPSR